MAWDPYQRYFTTTSTSADIFYQQARPYYELTYEPYRNTWEPTDAPAAQPSQRPIEYYTRDWDRDTFRPYPIDQDWIKMVDDIYARLEAARAKSPDAVKCENDDD